MQGIGRRRIGGPDVRVEAIHGLVTGHTGAPLLEGRLASRNLRLFADRTDGRKEDGGQDTDDGDYGKQLNERET
jgi:hypothetical protein